MKKSLIACAAMALVLMFASVALAENGGFYGSVKAGGSFLDATTSESNSNSTAATKDKFTTKSVGAIGVAAGYNWIDYDIPVRTELEYMYRSDFKYKYEDANATYSNEINIQTVMLNLYWDFYNSTSFTPYITGGAGVAIIDEDYSTTGLTTTGVSKTTTNLALNVGAGVGWNLTDSLLLDLEYRYDYFGNGKKVTMTGAAATGDYEAQAKNLSTHSVLLGLRYQF